MATTQELKDSEVAVLRARRHDDMVESLSREQNHVRVLNVVRCHVDSRDKFRDIADNLVWRFVNEFRRATSAICRKRYARKVRVVDETRYVVIRIAKPRHFVDFQINSAAGGLCFVHRQVHASELCVLNLHRIVAVRIADRYDFRYNLFTNCVSARQVISVVSNDLCNARGIIDALDCRSCARCNFRLNRENPKCVHRRLSDLKNARTNLRQLTRKEERESLVVVRGYVLDISPLLLVEATLFVMHAHLYQLLYLRIRTGTISPATPPARYVMPATSVAVPAPTVAPCA